ncbi:MAG: septum site-determining protein MinD [Clostridiales bacterium]|nr:septum site-determining protein MinD [Clostridiales bacterium]
MAKASKALKAAKAAEAARKRSQAKVWLIASGKGGVGKSTLSSSLAMALTESGLRVCVVDADIGLRDQDVLLNLENRIVYDVLDVQNGDCLLPQALISPADYPNLSLLPASQFSRCRDLEPKAFRQILSTLRSIFDHIIIDCPAGIERGLRGLMNNEIDETVLVCTPDDVCIRNADRVVPLMEKKGLPRPWVIVNRLQEDLIRSGEMYSAQVVADTLDLPLMGEVPEDPSVYRAVLQRIPVTDIDCPARTALYRIARRMTGMTVAFPQIGTARLPWYKRMKRAKVKEVKRIAH